MSKHQVDAIRKFVNPTFSLEDPSLPIGLCLFCAIRLAQQMKEQDATHCMLSDPTATRYKAPEPIYACSSYSNSSIRQTRSAEGRCQCRICIYGHTSGLVRTIRLSICKIKLSWIV